MQRDKKYERSYLFPHLDFQNLCLSLQSEGREEKKFFRLHIRFFAFSSSMAKKATRTFRLFKKTELSKINYSKRNTKLLIANNSALVQFNFLQAILKGIKKVSDCFDINFFSNFNNSFLQIFPHTYLFLQLFLDNGPHTSNKVQFWNVWRSFQNVPLPGGKELFDDVSFVDWCNLVDKYSPNNGFFCGNLSEFSGSLCCSFCQGIVLNTLRSRTELNPKTSMIFGW